MISPGVVGLGAPGRARLVSDPRDPANPVQDFGCISNHASRHCITWSLAVHCVGEIVRLAQLVVLNFCFLEHEGRGFSIPIQSLQGKDLSHAIMSNC